MTHLLTCHGTLICRAPLRHLPVALPPGAAPLSLAAPPVPGTTSNDPELGLVTFADGDRAGLLTISRGGFFMCAEAPGDRVVFNRTEANGWEMFLPLTPADLRDLRHILRHAWIGVNTRRVVRRTAVAPQEGFVLRLGRFVADLRAGLAPLVTLRDAEGRPARLSVDHAGTPVELVIAEARGSALLPTPPASDTGRQLAEAIAIALHRHIAGTEPSQAVFEQQAEMIAKAGILPGLETVIDTLLPVPIEPAEPREPALPALPARTRAPAQVLTKALAQFGPAPPARLGGHAASDVLEAANAALHRFLDTMQITTRATFGLYDRAAFALPLHPEALLLTAMEDGVRVRLPADRPPPWGLMQHALPLIYLLDSVRASGAARDASFLAEVGDDGCLPSVAFCSQVRTGCLVPDPDFMANDGYASVRELARTRAIAWPDRVAKVFWRGSSTGQRRKMPPSEAAADDFTWLPRLDLCRRARDSALARHYDVGISRITQIPEPDLVARIEQAGFCKPPANREVFFAHKAIIVIDGNANAWSGLFCALLSGACVLLVTSPHGHRQWYYDSLEPWLHYVPVRSDLKDLDRVVKWVMQNDSDARAIGEAGRAFADSLTFESAVQDSIARLAPWIGSVRLPRIK